MNTKLFVGNLPFALDEAGLRDIFSPSGAVVSVAIPIDRETGRKRGFAFVEMENSSDAEEAVKRLNGSTVGGRQIVVNPANPREEKNGGGGGGRGGGGKRW
jgi:RNA recognition motif-containing protein